MVSATEANDGGVDPTQLEELEDQLLVLKNLHGSDTYTLMQQGLQDSPKETLDEVKKYQVVTQNKKIEVQKLVQNADKV